MTTPLTIGLQSKGRLKEQAEAWLADCGFRLEVDGGERGYRASIAGLPGAQRSEEHTSELQSPA